MWLLLAQATDPISGGAGWVGAGLLGAVLSWLLLKHLPEKDRQQKDLIDSHNSKTKEITDTHAACIRGINDHHERVLAQSREDFAKFLGRVIEHCQAEMAGVTKLVEKDLQAISVAIAKIDWRGGVDLDELEAQVVELKKKLQLP